MAPVDLKSDLEQMFQDWDRAETPAGPAYGRYEVDYTESLDNQGVTRTLLLPLHIAQERALAVGSVLNRIYTMDGRQEGPFVVETFERQSDATVLLRLRPSTGA